MSSKCLEKHFTVSLRVFMRVCVCLCASVYVGGSAMSVWCERERVCVCGVKVQKDILFLVVVRGASGFVVGDIGIESELLAVFCVPLAFMLSCAQACFAYMNMYVCMRVCLFMNVCVHVYMFMCVSDCVHMRGSINQLRTPALTHAPSPENVSNGQK